MEPIEVVVHADHVELIERLIVAPASGVFRPRRLALAPAGETVTTGETLGAIERPGDEVDVVSAHPGLLMGLLVLPGERVRDHQPLAWVRPRGGLSAGGGNDT